MHWIWLRLWLEHDLSYSRTSTSCNLIAPDLNAYDGDNSVVGMGSECECSLILHPKINARLTESLIDNHEGLNSFDHHKINLPELNTTFIIHPSST